uniref:Uncharacterized protein n=1 Tax=Pseudo-nitzschia delicatissima TaxID=44447 RepID=A0A7S0Y6I3_9STRA|mmetsp:Transcript_4653/g.9691  ORF Transcript_4653/g.9691 Transcript_4653/m.9691 type:complete len:500 (+) Transcript_4653:198-1697(+)
MDCQSENPSVPPGIRFVEPEKNRTFKRKRPWGRFKRSLSNALNAVTPGGKSKPLRTASQLRHSFLSTTERTEDASSEFFLTTSEQPIEVELSSVTKPAVESESSSDETNDSLTGEQNDDESSALEETNQVTEQETKRPSLKKMDSGLVHGVSKQVSFKIEKDFQAQAMLQTRGLKQPCYLSLKQKNTFDELPTFLQAPDLPCDIGSEKWELSIPTIDEEKSFEFLSSRLERRSALFLKREGPIEPEPKRVERRNAIAIHTEKPKLTQQPKRTKRRKEIITNLEELERFQPKSSKMERRNAIVIHIESWELSRSYSNKMERRNAIIIHDHDQLGEEIFVSSDEYKFVQFKAKRKKGKQKRSKSKRIDTRQFSTARNQGSNGKILEHRCKFSIRGGLLAVSGIMVAVFVAALPIIIDDFFVMRLQTTTISLTSQQNDCVYDDIMLGKASKRNDSQLLGGAQFLSKAAGVETSLPPKKIITLNMDEAKNFLRELDFFDLPLF